MLQYCSALCFFVFCFDLQGMWGLSSLCSVSYSVMRDSLKVTPWTTAHQAHLSMGFTRQEYWSGLPFPSPRNLPDPGIEPGSPALQADPLPTELWGKPLAPWPGIRPAPSALEGEVSATGPPGKSLASLCGGVFLSRGYLAVRSTLNGMLGGLTSSLWCFLPPSLLICPWGWVWSCGPGVGVRSGTEQAVLADVLLVQSSMPLKSRQDRSPSSPVTTSASRTPAVWIPEERYHEELLTPLGRNEDFGNAIRQTEASSHLEICPHEGNEQWLMAQRKLCRGKY